MSFHATEHGRRSWLPARLKRCVRCLAISSGDHSALSSNRNHGEVAGREIANRVPGNDCWMRDVHNLTTQLQILSRHATAQPQPQMGACAIDTISGERLLGMLDAPIEGRVQRQSVVLSSTGRLDRNLMNAEALSAGNRSGQSWTSARTRSRTVGRSCTCCSSHHPLQKEKDRGAFAMSGLGV